ncbi:hypothetical protein [Nostoc sp. CHAB 5715]|uniref:hypothetical protein n=1 Tax=Nostoc sp. CHAB 5715 TaxID=2780400 RepID=UPI001E3FF50B|nr:hypothetical protein [Nostoc sp. CHAB 5715]MCC5626467.1 hypothetical protein [Nostoc sp. CHAB 5715]
MNQPTLFDLEAFTNFSLPTPVYDPFWDEIETAPEHTLQVLEQVTSSTLNTDTIVREQKLDPIESAPEQVCVREQVTPGTLNTDTIVREQKLDPIESAPEHTHWVEEYWVKRCGKKHKYYRYCWMHGRKIQHRHIGGGNVRSPLSNENKLAVEIAISDGHSPCEIEKLIRQQCGRGRSHF